MMELEPLRMTELRALVAARLAMVLPLTCFPPSTEFIRFVLIERATEEAALDAARSAVFFLAAAFLASSRSCAAAARASSFSAAASSLRRCLSSAFSSFSRCFSYRL